MAQRSLQELVDHDDPMWPIVQGWINAASHPVTVLPAERPQAEATLLTLNVTTRSPLGAMAYETGGILVDHGWLRLLGASSELMRDSLLAWNGMGERAVPNSVKGAMVIAHDVAGGFYAVNLGAFGDGPRTVFYFAPDTLRWTDLELSCADFLHWAITGDLETFFKPLRWSGWEEEVGALNGDTGVSFWPMFWAAVPSVNERLRRTVPQRELWLLQRDVAEQVANLPPGSKIRISFQGNESEA